MKKYTPGIQKLAFHLTHVRIIVTYHCGKERHEVFKNWSKKHGVLFQSDYAEQIASIFAHQIQS